MINLDGIMFISMMMIMLIILDGMNLGFLVLLLIFCGFGMNGSLKCLIDEIGMLIKVDGVIVMV